MSTDATIWAYGRRGTRSSGATAVAGHDIGGRASCRTAAVRCANARQAVGSPCAGNPRRSASTPGRRPAALARVICGGTRASSDRPSVTRHERPGNRARRTPETSSRANLWRRTGPDTVAPNWTKDAAPINRCDRAVFSSNARTWQRRRRAASGRVTTAAVGPNWASDGANSPDTQRASDCACASSRTRKGRLVRPAAAVAVSTRRARARGACTRGRRRGC